MFCALLMSRYQVSVYRTNGPLGFYNQSKLIVGCFISSPEPKAHRRAYRILMVRRPFVGVRRRPSVSRKQFQTSSFPKPLA